MIHPTAVIHPQAEVDPTTIVGPYVVIDGGVVVGPHCVLGPHVYLTGRTRMGTHNRLHAGCVLGDAPQDLKYKDAPTGLMIGHHNLFREHATVHRSNTPEEETVIGSHGFFMANSHVGHNCHLADHVILANGVLLGGHVLVQERAFISGNCLVHQFVRVGALSLMQGGAAISQDLPPYTMARGDNGISGLNTVGLRRAGFSAAQRLELRQLYHHLFCARQPRREAVEAARQKFHSKEARVLLDFVASSRRGICADRTHREESD